MFNFYMWISDDRFRILFFFFFLDCIFRYALLLQLFRPHRFTPFFRWENVFYGEICPPLDLHDFIGGNSTGNIV